MNDYDDNSDFREHRRNLLLCIVSGVVVFLILGAVYYSMRTTFSRITRDFISPYLNLPIQASDAMLTPQTILMNSKKELAGALLKSERENRSLRAQKAAADGLEKENRTLRALMNLNPGNYYRPVFADVIARSVPTWKERFVINRGEADGVEPGNAVLASDGKGVVAMIGQVRSVSRHTAVVVTLFSDDCRISVKLSRANRFGGLEFEGGSRSLPGVRYLPLAGDYTVGDEVVTSGISERAPAELKIGTVLPAASGAVVESRDRIYAYATVRPYINPAEVRQVCVLVRKDRKGQKTP